MVVQGVLVYTIDRAETSHDCPDIMSQVPVDENSCLLSFYDVVY